MPDYDRVDAAMVAAWQEAEAHRDEELARLESFLWQTCAAQGVLNSATADPNERAKAASIWAELFRLAHASRGETAEERATRLDCLETVAAHAGLSPLLIHLREFALDIAAEALADSDPAKKIGCILRGPPKTRRGPRKGTTKRPLRERVEIAAEVQRGRYDDMSLETASEKVAENMKSCVSGVAVRRIYEKEKATKAGASLVRLVAIGKVKV
jgi:hypothetical protein